MNLTMSILITLGCLLLPLTGHAHGGEDHSQDKSPPAPLLQRGEQGVPPFDKGGAGGISAEGSAPQRLPDGGVFMPKPTQRLLQLRSVQVKAEALSGGAELKGHVIADPNASGRIQAPAAGRVEPGPQGLPVLGQAVRKGQVLAYLAPVGNAIERGNQAAALADISGQLELAEKKVARYAQLEGSIPRKDIDAAQAELASLKARKAAVGAGLSGRTALAAPVSGVLSLSGVVQGQIVEAKDILFEVVDPQKLWVEALAYDTAITSQVTGANIETGKGQILPAGFVGAGLTLREQAIPLHFRLTPPLPALSVGEKVKLHVQTRDKVQGMAVPQGALTRNSAGEPIVWVKTGAESFTPRKITFQPLDAQRMAVTAGLKPGERVITQGSGLLSQVR